MRKTAIPTLLVLLTMMALPLTASAADDSAATYKAKCAACHSTDGSGKTALAKTKKLPDFRSADFQKRTEAELIEAIANGTPTTKATHAYKSKGLTDAQIKGLAAHIRTFAAK